MGLLFTFVWHGHFVWTAFVDVASCDYLYLCCGVGSDQKSGSMDHGGCCCFQAAWSGAGESGDGGRGWKEAIRGAS